MVVLCLVLIIVMPVMGLMYVDMNNATNAALAEIRKMKELRLKILKERLDADRKPIEGDDPAQ